MKRSSGTGVVKTGVTVKWTERSLSFTGGGGSVMQAVAEYGGFQVQYNYEPIPDGYTWTDMLGSKKRTCNQVDVGEGALLGAWLHFTRGRSRWRYPPQSDPPRGGVLSWAA